MAMLEDEVRDDQMQLSKLADRRLLQYFRKQEQAGVDFRVATAVAESRYQDAIKGATRGEDMSRAYSEWRTTLDTAMAKFTACRAAAVQEYQTWIC